MANDFTPYVLEVIAPLMAPLRNQFTLASRIYSHGAVSGNARWIRDGNGVVETKTAGTQLTGLKDSTDVNVDIEPTTQKLSRFYIEDKELAVSSVKRIADQKIPNRLKLLVNDIEGAIAALYTSATHTVGALGGGITKTLLADAVAHLETADAMAETLVVHTNVKSQMKTDDAIQKYLEMRQDQMTGNFVLNVFDFEAMGRSNQIVQPEAGKYANLAFQREAIGIAFGDLSSVPEGAGRFVRTIQDPITQMTFRVIQKSTSDGLGQEFIVDVMYGVGVQEPSLMCCILS